MSSSDKVPPVLGSPSATDPEGVAADFTVAATAEAKEASAPDAVVADVAPKVSAGGRYSDAAVAVMTEDQLWTAVSAGLRVLCLCTMHIRGEELTSSGKTAWPMTSS